MTQNLNNSQLDRQNILNNPSALTELENSVKLKGINFDGKIWFTTQQVADYFEVDIRTIRNYLEKNDTELRQNGYKIFTGKDLEQAKIQLGSETDFLTKTTILGLFDFRSFLNLGMLINDSDKARELRSLILDVFISIMNKNYGENRKYINQNDVLYIPVKNRHEKLYHPQLTKALEKFVDMGNNKYPYFNDKIYQFLFKERYKEYCNLLNLKLRENANDTHYSEIINSISQFELAFAEDIEDEFEKIKQKLSKIQTDEIFNIQVRKRLWIPLLQYARDIIASRDYVFRDIVHINLNEHIKALTFDEFKKFLGESKLLDPLTPQEKKQIEDQNTQNLFEEFEVEDVKNVFIRMNNK